MKSIIQSINPEHVFNMRFGGKRFPLKRIEVRKTAPKETPFKAYIYETKQKEKSFVSKTIDGVQTEVILRRGGCGKVVGEYICRKVEIVRAHNMIQAHYNNRPETRLTDEQLWAYASGKPLKFLYMEDVVFYDTPKELGENGDFKFPCVRGGEDCDSHRKCVGCKYARLWTGTREIYCNRWVTRPPQSWTYVEELEE